MYRVLGFSIGNGKERLFVTITESSDGDDGAWFTNIVWLQERDVVAYRGVPEPFARVNHDMSEFFHLLVRANINTMLVDKCGGVKPEHSWMFCLDRSMFYEELWSRNYKGQSFTVKNGKYTFTRSKERIGK